MIIGAVHYLGKQNITFRGHRVEIDSDSASVNPGNVIYLLLKLQAVNDSILHEQFYSQMMRNAINLHSDFKNEMTDILGKNHSRGYFIRNP